MLAPEKTANLIFEGDPNSSILNYSLYNTNNNFYKLDSIRVRKNKTIFAISKDFRYENTNTNKIWIEVYFTESSKVINRVIIINNFKSKEINMGIKVYKYYKTNDIPFWLMLYNDNDKEEVMNITSDNINDFFF